MRLSRAQLETLAIVAYRQPITRPEIDDIRGVDSSATLRLLLDRSLIRVLGKREEVGRPTLFGTTKEFLDFFSLGDLRELPTLREYSELTAESRQVMSDRLGVPLDENGELVEPETDLIDADGLSVPGSSGDFTTDNASIVDSILAEHAAAEAAAEGRTSDASAMAEAAMSGGHLDASSDAFAAPSSVHGDPDAGAMSLAGDVTTIESSRSEARSYIDAIRSSSFFEANSEAEPELDDVEVKADSTPEVESTGGAAHVEPRADTAHASSALETASIEHASSGAADEPHHLLETQGLVPANLGEDSAVELAAAVLYESSDLERPDVETSVLEAEPSWGEHPAVGEPDSVELASESSDIAAANPEIADVALETTTIDLAHLGETDDAELAAEAALEEASLAHAERPSELAPDGDAGADRIASDAASDDDDHGN
ncbi:hypothetical protein BH11MYX1_BH11MYX1_07810 [soil metagenome]